MEETGKKDSREQLLLSLKNKDLEKNKFKMLQQHFTISCIMQPLYGRKKMKKKMKKMLS